MRRLAACAIVKALVLSAAVAPLAHVHEYVGHDHPEHHHGPAVHGHEQSTHAVPDHHSIADNDHDPAIEAESCDAGRHVIGVTMASACAPQVDVDMAELPGPTVSAASAPIESAAPLTDVRVHGPPYDSRIPARAPP